MSVFFPISGIEIADRQRSFIDKKELRELADSIEKHGIMHPPVVHRTIGPDNKATGRLVCGERRIRAVELLYSEGKTFPSHSTIPVPPGYVPITPLESIDPVQLMEMEFDENTQRSKLDWQDECAALAAIEEARKVERPTATRLELAQDIQKKMGGPEKVSIGAIQKQVTQKLTVAAALATRPDLQKAKSSNEAYRILLNEQAERFSSALASRKLKKMQTSERIWDVRRGDLRQLMTEMDDNVVDLILTDPPYGTGIDTQKFAASTTHRYNDTEGYAKELTLFILQEGWRVTKPKANLFMFCKWHLFGFLKEAAARYGWSCWADPIIWQKSVAEGSAPWGKQGWIHTYEMALYATKGQRGIYGPIPDILNFAKVAARSRQHGAEKPLLLLDFLISKMSAPGDMVLDPCAGSGSTLLSAARQSRRSIGMEMDETYYNRAMTRMLAYEQGGTVNEGAADREATPPSAADVFAGI